MDYAGVRAFLKKGKRVEIQNYFFNLNRFAHTMANFKKPLMIDINGVMKNVAASIFLNRPLLLNRTFSAAYHDEAENGCPLSGGLSYHFSRFPNEMGTFFALIGGEFSETDMNNFHYLKGKYNLTGFGQIAKIGQIMRRSQPFYKINEIDKSDVAVEIDRPKENQRILRETLDRMRKEDGQKVLLDAYYRKKIVEYANVFEKEKNNIHTHIKANSQRYSRVNNDTLSFELDIMPDMMIPPEQNEFKFHPGAVFQNRVQILMLFKGRTLEEIYQALDQDSSLFAKKCAAIMRTRDQNLLRANLFLVREAVDSTFTKSIFNEHKVMNLLVENPELCPGLFVRSSRGSNVFNSAFNPDLAPAAADNNPTALTDRLVNLTKDPELTWEFPFHYVEHEMSPFREYYSDFPEAFLMYINEEKVRDPLKGENFKELIQFTFARYGIDYMNPAFTLGTVRAHFYHYLKSLRKTDVEVQRLREMFDNDSVFKDYVDSRVEFTNQLLSKDQFSDQNFEGVVNELLKESFSRAKEKHLGVMFERTSRLMEYEKEKELTRIRDLLIDQRMVEDTTLPKRRITKSLVEVTERITDISPTVQRALNFDEMQATVIKSFDFQVKDVVNYMLGNKELLFSKLRVVHPEGLRSAQAKSDLSEFTHQDLRLSEKEDPNKLSSKNNLRYINYGEGLRHHPDVDIEGYRHEQLYLTDGYYNLRSKYDYVEDLKYKGIPFTSHQFQRLQYLLYNGVNKKELDFRQVFLNNMVEDYEKTEGLLTWSQKTNIVSQFEEELFNNYEHLKKLEDVLDNLEEDFGFYKKFKKEVSIDWVDREIKRAREFYVIHSPEAVKRQREFVERERHNHRKFLEIDLKDSAAEFVMPKNDEEELRLGLELLGQLDEHKEKFWNVVKSYSGDLNTDSDTFKNTVFFRRIFDKMLNLYSTKKGQLDGENKNILDNLFEDDKFSQINNFVARNSYVEVMQFFAPHIFFNLACWGMRKMNDLMGEIKDEIEAMSAKDYRAKKNENIETILKKHKAWDAGLSVQANLELLDVVAFAFADFYQQYRNRLFFTEDILRKQYEELEVLERSEARKTLTKQRLLHEKDGGRAHEKTRFELMAEDMGLFFKPEEKARQELNPESENDLFILKDFLKENGINSQYLTSVQDFSEVQKKLEQATDATFQDAQDSFAENFLPQAQSTSKNMSRRLEDLESEVDALLASKSETDLEQKKMIVALAKEIRLANNYTLTENLEKLGNSELPSFDLFRKEKAKTKRFRQRLIEKLHLLMGNDQGYQNDPFRDSRMFNPFIDVEIEGLNAKSFKVPLNELKPKSFNEVNLVEINTLIEQDLNSSVDVEANPLALAMLGVTVEGDSLATEGGHLLNILGESPVSVLDQWVNHDRHVPDLKNVQVRDLKEVFLKFLQTREVCVTDKLSNEAFIQMQLKQGMADILMKESFNEKDMIEFLSVRGHRGLGKDLLLEGFENFTRTETDEEWLHQNEVTLVRDDMKVLLDLSRAQKFDVPYKTMKKVMTNLEKNMEMLLDFEKFKYKNLDFENPDEDLKEMQEKTVHNLSEIYPFDMSDAEDGIDVNHYDPTMPVAEEIDTSEMAIFQADPEPEPPQLQYDVYDSQDEEQELEMVKEIQVLELDHKSPVLKVQDNYLDHVGISQPMLVKVVKMGLFFGVRDSESDKIFNALEMQKLARDTSNSRMKQYLMMYKVAETPMEKGFCLQKLRKELLTFSDFNPEWLLNSDKFGHFELFVDALARQIEGDVQHLQEESPEMSKVVQDILNRKYISSEAKTNFKVFLEEQVKKANSGRIRGIESMVNERESDNLQLSGAKLTQLVESTGAVNIDNFLSKLRTAFLGNWEEKNLSQGEIYELIQLRRDLYKLVALKPNTAELSLAKVEEILVEGGMRAEYEEVEELVKQGKTVLQALRDSASIGKEVQQLKTSQKSHFYRLSDAQYFHIVLDQIRKTKSLSFANFKENFNRANSAPSQSGLMALYFPEIGGDTILQLGTENPRITQGRDKDSSNSKI